MTLPENGKSLWTESQVETLLEDFFQREMPAALRKDNPSPPPTRESRNRISRKTPVLSAQRVPAASGRANSWTGGAIVILSSLMMLLVGLMIWDGSRNPVVPTETNADSDTENRSKPGELGPNPLDALQHNGQGPVESRPRLPHVGIGNPEKPDFPELDIEVFPLDPRSEPDIPPEMRGLPEFGPPLEDNPPMPEENRSLPESRSSGAKDVDEEDNEPLLPELRSQSLEPRDT